MRAFVGAALLAGIIAMVGCSGGSSKIKKEDVAKIKVGMTLGEVEAILGPGKKVMSISGTNKNGVTRTSEAYGWGDDAYIEFLKDSMDHKDTSEYFKQHASEIRHAKGVGIGFVNGKVDAVFPPVL